jgi:hypothetical protein
MEGTLIIQIHGLKDLTQKEQAQVTRALKLGEPVLSSDIFKEMVLKLRMSETRGFSNLQIYEKFMSGSDSNGPADGDLDIDIVGFWDSSRTIGSTNVYGKIQRLNRRFLGIFDDSDIFGHVVHETMHRFGWIHAGAHSTSVPYKWGYAARDAFRKYYKENHPALVGIISRPQITFHLK